MAAVRSIFWVWPLIVASTIGYGLVASTSALLGQKRTTQARLAKSWAKSLLYIAGVRVEVQGLTNTKLSNRYVFVSNHLSYLDAPVLLAFLPPSLVFMAKRWLFSVPFLGWHLALSGHIPVGGRRRIAKALNLAVDSVQGGSHLVVFAEGERSETGALYAFKNGAAFVAIRSRASLVPIALGGVDRVLARRSWIIRPGRVTLTIGEPLDTRGVALAQRAALVENIRSRIERLLQERTELPNGISGKPQQHG